MKVTHFHPNDRMFIGWDSTLTAKSQMRDIGTFCPREQPAHQHTPSTYGSACACATQLQKERDSVDLLLCYSRVELQVCVCACTAIFLWWKANTREQNCPIRVCTVPNWREIRRFPL
jgi:hypothetical protein